MRKTLFSIVILAGYVSPGYTQDQLESAAQIANTRGSDARELFEESKPFFGDNAADSSFSPDVAINDGPKLGEFQEGVRKISLKEKLRGEAAEEEKLEKAMLQAKLGLANQPQAAAKKELANSNDVISEFGNPEEEPEIKAKEDAPKPYQGMISALKVGDDKLAYQYAKQYARYIKGVQANAKRVTGLTGLAMTSEGMMSEDSWALKDTNEIDKEFYQQDKIQKASADAQSEGEISATAKKIMALASEENAPKRLAPARGSVDEAELKGFAEDEQVQKQYARKSAGSIPHDPRGKADIYFFFRPADSRAAEMAQEMEKVFEQVRQDSKVRFAALTIDDSSESEKVAFQKMTGVTFPIIDGGIIAKEMKIKGSPTVVIAAGSTGEAVIENGKRGASFILEKVRIVKGEL